jgi:phospholipid/cholesterol/gamma-HCH transport system substrate-binding protein
MGEKLRNMMIGLFVIIACSLSITLIMFLKPSVGDAKTTLYVRFANINNINVNTRVLFAGKPVGEVVAIDEIYDARSQPTDALGSVYFYQLTLKIDSSVKVYDTDQIALQTSGLLGEKSIAILPKAPPKGVTPHLVTDQPIYAESIDPIQNAFIEISQVANEVEGTFRRLSQWIEMHGESLGRSVNQLDLTLQQAQIFLSEINSSQIIQEWKAGSRYFPQIMQKINRSFDTLESYRFFDHLALTTEHMEGFSLSLKEISRHIAQGSGTLGRLVMSDECYQQLLSLFKKGNQLMKNLNHFGLLFHLNKQWQRLERERLETPSPASFQDCLNKEMDTIQVATEKLEFFLKKEGGTLSAWAENPDLKHRFADLLRTTSRLNDCLYQNNPKNREYEKKSDQAFFTEEQGAKANEKCEMEPMPHRHSSSP